MLRRGAPHRRAGLHPADRRRRGPHGRRRRHAAAGRRGQGRRQHRRDRPARADRRDRRPVRQPGAGALAGRAPPRRTAGTAQRVRGHHPRRPARHRPRRRRLGRAGPPSWAPARSCSTRWTPTAPRTASTWSSSRPSARASTSRSSPPAARARSAHFAPAVAAGADAVLAASVFHFGELTHRRGQGRPARGRPPGPLTRTVRPRVDAAPARTCGVVAVRSAR